MVETSKYMTGKSNLSFFIFQHSGIQGSAGPFWSSLTRWIEPPGPTGNGGLYGCLLRREQEGMACRDAVDGNRGRAADLAVVVDGDTGNNRPEAIKLRAGE